MSLLSVRLYQPVTVTGYIAQWWNDRWKTRLIWKEAVVTYLSSVPTFDSVTKQNLRNVGFTTDFRKACFSKRRWQIYRCVTAKLQHFDRSYIAITNHVPAEHCSSALSVRQAITEHILTFRRLMSTIVDVPHR